MTTNIEHKTYVLDLSNNKIHYYRDCTKIGANYKYIPSNDSWKTYYNIPVCERCQKECNLLFYQRTLDFINIVLKIFPLCINDNGKNSINTSYLWVQSNEYGKPVKLPFYQALRVVRKQNWRICEMVPVKTSLFTKVKMFLKNIPGGSL